MLFFASFDVFLDRIFTKRFRDSLCSIKSQDPIRSQSDHAFLAYLNYKTTNRQTDQLLKNISMDLKRLYEGKSR